jgi:hypothetical protein
VNRAPGGIKKRSAITILCFLSKNLRKSIGNFTLIAKNRVPLKSIIVGSDCGIFFDDFFLGGAAAAAAGAGADCFLGGGAAAAAGAGAAGVVLSLVAVDVWDESGVEFYKSEP